MTYPGFESMALRQRYYPMLGFGNFESAPVRKSLKAEQAA